MESIPAGILPNPSACNRDGWLGHSRNSDPEGSILPWDRWGGWSGHAASPSLPRKERTPSTKYAHIPCGFVSSSQLHQTHQTGTEPPSPALGWRSPRCTPRTLLPALGHGYDATPSIILSVQPVPDAKPRHDFPTSAIPLSTPFAAHKHAPHVPHTPPQ